MARYNIGDFLIYGLNGACQVVEIGTLDFAGPDKIYYSLKPVSDSRSTIFVPLMKEEEELRSVISKNEADEILEKVKKAKAATYTPVRENCDVILKSGDNVAVSQMIKLLRGMRRENRKVHKGLNIQEERLLKDAERVFFSEMATAYELSIEEVINKIGDVFED